MAVRLAEITPPAHPSTRASLSPSRWHRSSTRLACSSSSASMRATLPSGDEYHAWIPTVQTSTLAVRLSVAQGRLIDSTSRMAPGTPSWHGTRALLARHSTRPLHVSLLDLLRALVVGWLWRG